MPMYMMDLKMWAGGSEVQGQVLLSVHHPRKDRWAICSSVPELQGLRGNLTIQEKLGFNGTVYWKNDEMSENPRDGLFFLRDFRGGINDYESWAVGKGGTGIWLNGQPPGYGRDFTWAIRGIDTSNDA